MNKYPNLALALASVVEKEADEFMAQLDPEPDFELSAKTERKLAKLVKRRDKAYYPLICTAGRRVACVFALIIVCCFSAMSIKPVRAAVFEFISNSTDDHTHITSIDNQPKITTNEFVEYELQVPEGFALVEKNITDNSVAVVYTLNNKYIIYRQERTEHYSINLDDEEYTIDYYNDETGQTYILQYNDNDYTITWKKNEYVFSVKSNLTKNEILDLCKQTNNAD